MFKHTLAFASFAITPLLAVTAHPVSAQESAPLNSDRMAEVVSAEADSGAFMGTVLVARGDNELLSRAWG
ncbi:MAG: hypothetical protein AAGI28_15060, partial [Pseudomonadota bacterium]